ncbi:hypothetical protein CANCADRAFT_2559 [Tortispora caseinolytica NRRL Y-17796]|uniref:CNH domain-containing protein n=1 Tax=Tortispora caseinolytica NRRL Y-17796 TaxID=767744 RepID=A0A1E4TGG5_9ASCO|nr:hypothetical protein CANCADRAFT_2559 [Tortispora caseinolytica NRRL Y-17796]
MPYTIHEILSSVDSSSPITAVEYSNSSLYFGTQNGEIVHCFYDSATSNFVHAAKIYVPASRGSPIDSFILLPHVSRALILSNSQISFFSLPELSPLSLGRIKDVKGMCYDPLSQPDAYALVTVFTSTAVRIVHIDPEKVKLVRNIDYANAIVGSQHKSLALVATSANYDILDIENGRKIPLFPIISDPDSTDTLAPLLAKLPSNEFLLATASGSNQPAVGIFINSEGDITRGTITWESYPSSIAALNSEIAAIYDQKINLHDTNSQSFSSSLALPDSSEYFLQPVLTDIEIPFLPLASKIASVPLIPSKELETQLEQEHQAAVKMASVSSQVVLCRRKDGALSTIIQPPPLFQLEELILNSKFEEALTQLDVLIRTTTTESQFLQISYIQQALGFAYIAAKRYQDALKHWDSTSIDPRIVIFLYSELEIKSPPWVFAGVLEIIKSTKKLKHIGSAESLAFFKMFLASWFEKKEYETSEQSKLIFKCVEIAYLQLLLTKGGSADELLNFVRENVIESTSIAANMLEEAKRYYALSILLKRKGKYRQVCATWVKLLEGEWYDPDFVNGEQQMADFLESCDDHACIWEYGIWLVKRNPALGLNVFLNNPIANADTSLVLKKVRDIGGNTLKIFLEERLAKLSPGTSEYQGTVQELLGLYCKELNNCAVYNALFAKEVKKTYSDYRELGLSKPSYIDYWNSSSADISLAIKPLADMRHNTLVLLRDVSFTKEDARSLRDILQPSEKVLLTEVAILAASEGKLDEFYEITIHEVQDYKEALRITEKLPEDSPALKASAHTLFEHAVRLVDSEESNEFVTFLLKKFGRYYNIEYVLDQVSDAWPVERLRPFLLGRLRTNVAERLSSMMLKSVNRSNAAETTYQLQVLGSLPPIIETTGDDVLPKE